MHEIAKEIGYKFEAKKDALRQVQDGGVKVTLVIHPQDMPGELYGDPMGQRYVVVMVPLNDDETPMVKPKSLAGQAKLLAQEDSYWIGFGYDTQEQAEKWIEGYCGVESCSQITEGTEAARRLKQLQARFLEWRDQASYLGME